MYNELESCHEDISMFFRWFLLLYKTENSQTPRASFDHVGLKVITMGSGMEGKEKKKRQTFTQSEILGAAQLLSPNHRAPAWGLGRSRRKLTALLL